MITNAFTCSDPYAILNADGNFTSVMKGNWRWE